MMNSMQSVRTAFAIVVLLATSAGMAAAEDAALKHANQLLAKHPVIDGHNDLPMAIRESKEAPRDVAAYDLNKATTGDTDLARMRKGRLGGQFWSVWVPSGDETKSAGRARIQLEQIDIALRMIERYPNDLRLALTADDIDRANRDGKIASLLGVEGAHTIENSLGVLRTYHRLGVRYMTLTHSDSHDWARSSTDPANAGLTAFGSEVVREMNRLGILVDISHVNTQTMQDVLNVTHAPVIFSHSNPMAITRNERNVPDEVLRRLPKNGGLIMASFITYFTVKQSLIGPWEQGMEQARAGKQGKEREAAERKYESANPRPRATLTDVADHVDYLRKVAGVDHIGIGSDFYGEPAAMAQGLEDVSTFPALFAELIRRGWKDEDLIKLSRGNLLRVM
ncbi:dipeptidase, partial [Steroidobacter sp.]|uniref:dipeptidase n=1 Tax=Steroidobacter sp. TaxID=1978227 RepID=UPI001A3958B3